MEQRLLFKAIVSCYCATEEKSNRLFFQRRLSEVGRGPGSRRASYGAAFKAKPAPRHLLPKVQELAVSRLFRDPLGGEGGVLGRGVGVEAGGGLEGESRSGKCDSLEMRG